MNDDDGGLMQCSIFSSGILIAILIVMTFVEPSRRNDKSAAISSNDGAVDEPIKWDLMGRLFCRPFLLVFFLASALRMGAGYCFAYNNQVGLGRQPIVTVTKNQ